jgi:poly(3-hydroxybutyrate) depolymerase
MKVLGRAKTEPRDVWLHAFPFSAALLLSAGCVSVGSWGDPAARSGVDSDTAAGADADFAPDADVDGDLNVTGDSDAAADNDGEANSDTEPTPAPDPDPGNDSEPSAGCGKEPTLTNGTHNIGGRKFIMRIPEVYDNNNPHRLIFAFHWWGGTAEDVDGGGSSGYTWSYYGLRERAENTTIFVAPQGIGNGWANGGGSDLRFVDDMIELIVHDLCVDENRLFALGFSYGGGMSFGIACDRADVFRAVAVYGGAQLSGCGDGSKPMAYMGIHGINDGTCNIGGGRGMRDRFVKNNGCTPQDAPEPSRGSLTHIVTTYSGCDPGYPVVWAAFDGGGHTPAPVDGSSASYDTGDKTWTKEEVWKFFTQF